MPDKGRVFRTVQEALEAYFEHARYGPQQQFVDEKDPREAGEDLARDVTRATKARVIDALARPEGH